MADETTRIDTWLRARLAADSALTAVVGTRLYGELAPQATATPFVVWQLVDVDDVVGATAATRIMVTSTWAVKAVADAATFAGPLATAADRIDAVLHAAVGGAAGDATVWTAVRERPLRLVEVDDGVTWRHLGGIYRIWAT
jgi:hypothetical protein